MANKPKIKREFIVDERLIRQISSAAMGDIYDALVEIITNCDDSYHRLFLKNKRPRDGGDILVQISPRHRGKPTSVIIKDKAEGMTFDDMDIKLVRMGKRTGGKGSRGFMARGLRDCIEFGDIKVESIVDGKYYACQLRREPRQFEELEKGTRVAESKRKELLGTGNCGTVITLEYDSSIPLPQFDTLSKLLPQHYALRDIIGKGESKITIKSGEKQKSLMAIQIPGDEILNIHLKLDDYPDATIHLRVWKSPDLLNDKDSRMRKSGILIVGGRAIHQCTLLKYDNDDIAKYYFGRLDCDYIQTLLDEYDEHSATGRPTNNPSLLIDPGRQTGLRTSHPFTKQLFAKINEQIKLLIDKDRKNDLEGKKDISNQDMRKRLNELAKHANKFLKENVSDTELTPGEETALDMVAEKGVYILPPKFNIGVNKERSLTFYVRHDLYDKQRETRVQSENEGIISLVTTFSDTKLKLHPSNESIFYGSFQVRGVACGNAKIIVHPSKDIQAEAIGTTVRTMSPNVHDFENNMEFERKKYTIPEGKTKKLKIYVKRFLVKNDTFARVVCQDESVVVKGGGQCQLILQPDSNYAVGEIEVEGRNINRRAVKVTARLDDLTATTNVRVVERKGVESNFQFDLVDKNLGELRARWADLDNKPNLLEISAVHPSIKKYFGSPPDFPLQNELVCRALLAEIITESICWRVLRREMRSRPGGFQYEGKDAHDVLDDIGSNIQKKINKFVVIAHKILSGDNS